MASSLPVRTNPPQARRLRRAPRGAAHVALLAAAAHCGAPRRAPPAPAPLATPAPAATVARSAEAPAAADAAAVRDAAAPAVAAPSRVRRDVPWLAGQTGDSSGSVSGAPRILGTVGSAQPSPWTPPANADAATLVRSVAAEYRAWGRVDDELRWAPWLCRLPMPSRPRFSAAEQGTPHAEKLYFLYARDRFAYGRNGRALAGQVLVKESWTAHPVDIAQAVHINATPVVAHRGEQYYEPDQYGGLFVMIRVPDGTRDSDASWVYGTVSPTGEVTAAGRVASCIGCHVQAGPSRLFGLRGAAARQGGGSNH